MTDWTALREFNRVKLTDSYVLSWLMSKGSLIVDLDLALDKEHALYEKPRPSQKCCYRPAHLVFPDCGFVSNNGTGYEGNLTAETARTFGLGAISGFRRAGEGLYELQGSFGKVRIRSERPMLRLNVLENAD